MNGRIFKFRLDNETINHDMDNFLFNIVKNRQRNQIYLTKGRVALNTLEENDYIFIQSKNKITHYMKCNSQGPKKYDRIEISVKDIKKFEVPKESKFKGKIALASHSEIGHESFEEEGVHVIFKPFKDAAERAVEKLLEINNDKK